MGSNRHPRCCEITEVKITCDSKITKLDLACSGKKQIAEFEITMDDTMVVCILKCRTDLSGQFRDDLPIEHTLDLQETFDCPAVNEFHHVEQCAIVFAAPKIAHDMRVAKAFEYRHFTSKPGSNQRILRNSRMQFFDCDLLASRFFGRPIDGSDRSHAQNITNIEFRNFSKCLHRWLILHHLHMIG